MNFITQPIFKRWVILSTALYHQVRINHRIPFEQTYDIYIEYIINSKTEQQVLDKTINLELLFPKNSLKYWYWESIPEIHNLLPVAQFMWLYQRMKSILNLVDNNTSYYKQFVDKYKRQFTQEHFEFIQNADLFD